MTFTRLCCEMEISLFFTFAVVIELACAVKGPVIYWPLGDQSATCEAISNADTNYPNDTIYVGCGHPDVDYRALSLDGVSQYIRVTVPGGVKYKKLVFAFYVFPESDTGTLLHFKSNLPQNDTISEISINMVRNVVYVEYSVGDNNVFFTTSALSLVTNQWNFVAVERNFKKGRIKIYNERGDSTGVLIDDGHKNEFVLGNPGTITLGMNQATGKHLKGRFTCLAVFDDMVYKIVSSTPIFAFCEDPAVWACDRPLPSSVTVIDISDSTCTTNKTNIIKPSNYVATKVWPLTNYSHGYALQGMAPLHPQDPECSLYSPGYSQIQGKAMLYNGYQQSFAEMGLDVELLQHDFTLAFFVNPAHFSTGTILNFVYSKAPSIKWEIRLRVSDGDLQLMVWNSSAQCDTINITGGLSPDVWQYVAIQRTQADAGFSLVVNNNSYNGIRKYISPSGLTGDGNMFVGNSASNDDSFRGSLMCLIVFEGKLSDGKSSVIESCKSTFIPTGISMTACDAKPSLRASYFKMTRRNASPHPLSGSPSRTLSSSSLRRCSHACTEELHCCSFSFSADNTCNLFKFVAKGNGIVSNIKTNYFILQFSETG